MSIAESRGSRAAHSVWDFIHRDWMHALSRDELFPGDAAHLSRQQLDSLCRTRDELATALACLRQLTETPALSPRHADDDAADTDPYPAICANLRTALAHVRRAEHLN